MTEIINILNEEVKYDRTVNHDQRTYSECVKEHTVIYSQRENWSNLENQPKLVGNLDSVKRTTAASLVEETKLVKQMSQAASNIQSTASSTLKWNVQTAYCSTTSQRAFNLWNVWKFDHIPIFCPNSESIHNTFKLSRTTTNL